jgi:hypothetical protein
MWYLPYLRVRKFIAIYTIVVVALTVSAVAWHYWPGSTFRVGQIPEGIDGWSFAGPAGIIAAGIATALGLHLATENDGHLEFAWTQPTSRMRIALMIFVADVAALLAIELVTIGVMIAGADAIYARPIVVFDGSVYDRAHAFVRRKNTTESIEKTKVVVQSVNGKTLAVVRTDTTGASIHVVAPPPPKPPLPREIAQALLFLTLPLSVYGWIVVVSASLKCNRGTVAAIFWPAVLGLTGAASIPIDVIRSVVGTINHINPVSLYLSGGDPYAIVRMTFGCALAIAMLAIALVQWQRLEA